MDVDGCGWVNVIIWLGVGECGWVCMDVYIIIWLGVGGCGCPIMAGCG